MQKVIGILDIFTGTLMILMILLTNYFVIPRIASLYQQSNIDLTGNLTASYISSALLLVIGILNLYIGFRSFNGKAEEYFKWAIAMLVVNFTLGGILFYTSAFSIIGPIYRLTSSYQ